MPLDDASFFADIRRRAGITPTTPEYDRLNPQGIQVSLLPAELDAMIAALEYIQNAKEMIPSRQLIDKLKKLAGRPQPQPYKHNPIDPNNPYYGAALQRHTVGR